MVPFLLVLQKCPMIIHTEPFSAVERHSIAWPVNFHGVQHRLGTGDSIDMNDDRRLCHSDCESSDVGDTLIECATCFGIPDGLIKQLGEIVEECVLFRDIQGEDAV